MGVERLRFISSVLPMNNEETKAARCQIRLAAKAELASIQAIEYAADMLFPAGYLPDPDDVMPLEDLAEAQSNGLLCVAVWAGAIAGFAVLEQFEDVLHLAEMAVHPDFGRRGIGTHLLTAVIRQAIDRKLSGVTLTTFHDIPWNAPFYEKRGFRILIDSELNPMLRNILKQEENLGMKNRVAMLYAVGEAAVR